MTKEEALDLALEAIQSDLGTYNIPPTSKMLEAITAIKQARSAPVQEPVATWQRGEKQRASRSSRRQRIEELLRERVKPLAIAHEVGVTETRVRQIRKEMGL
jgi:hypothetical protein